LGKQNATVLTLEPLPSQLPSPPDGIQKTAGPATLFLLLFIKQKKFTETSFSKLSSNPYQNYIPADSTNYF
jgi:hypothetical protein